MTDQVTDTEPKYEARVIEKVETRPGCWNHLRVGVFRDGAQIGEYTRNYSSLYSTFFPFKQGDKWYALYSREYTSTRLMSLPDCSDIGGEEPHAHGFCPTQFFVPELRGREIDATDPQPVVANHQADVWALKVPTQDGKSWRYYWPDDKDHPQPDEARKVAYLKAKEKSHAASEAWSERHPFVTKFAPWGFVAGCVWGDDSSWKIQFLDLSRAAEGVVVRDDRFGYIELPNGVALKDAIDPESIYELNRPPERTRIRIALPVTFDLTGKRYSDDD